MTISQSEFKRKLHLIWPSRGGESASEGRKTKRRAVNEKWICGTWRGASSYKQIFKRSHFKLHKDTFQRERLRLEWICFTLSNNHLYNTIVYKTDFASNIESIFKLAFPIASQVSRLSVTISLAVCNDSLYTDKLPYRILQFSSRLTKVGPCRTCSRKLKCRAWVFLAMGMWTRTL